MRPNVLFILLDSCRADKVTGNDKSSVTPTLDKFINNGSYFFQNISSADGTLLSWASMFTGLHPFKTGISSEKFHKLGKNIPTFFETLKDNDYHFYGYLPAISKIVGIFPEFENDNSTFDYYLGLSDGLGKKILDLFDSNTMKSPWFTFLHIEDLHFPVNVPDKFNDEKYGKTNFDKAMSNFDTWLNKILARNNLQDTLVIFIADHGSYLPSIDHNGTRITLEVNASLQTTTRNVGKKIPGFLKPLKSKAFFMLERIRKQRRINKIKNLDLKPHQRRQLMWQRSDLDHFLYDDIVHVPLLFSGYGVPKGMKIPQQVRNLDVFPTILDVINLPNLNNIDGKSLLDLMNGKHVKESLAYIESTPLIKEIVTNDVVGIRSSEFKYFRSRDDPTKRVHLYNLKDDPFEDENISSKNPEIVSSMESELQKILSQKFDLEYRQNDEETEKIEDELRELGYL